MMLDAGTSWNIRIPRANQIQEVHVVAFAPDAAKAQKHPYPHALLVLGCTIEKLRAEAIGQNVEAERECTNILSSR